MAHKLTSILYEFFRLTIKNCIQNGCSYRASSLTLVSLLAIVPFMAVFFGLMTLLPNFDQIIQPIQHMIFNNFVPEAGRSVEQYILNFIGKASHFSLIGGGGVLVSSLLLIYNIELALNKTWHVTCARKPLNALIVYSSILILLPVLLGSSLLVSSYLRSMFLFRHEHIVQESTLMTYIPFILAWVGFTFLYYVMPNRKINLIHAQISAFLATLLFELAKLGFSFYLKYFIFYELIYGVFAIIPIFIMWVYVVWLITLFCAEINYSLSSYRK
jgi:membrane protein